MKNQAIIIGVVAIVCAGGGYWVGAHNAASQSPAGRSGQNGAVTFRNGGGARSGGNAVLGTIISKDATSFTVQLGGPNATSTNGTASGTQIIIYNSSTPMEKTVAGSSADLTVGANVLVTGTANSDGSLTAQSVQIRSAGFGRPSGQ